MKEFKFALYAIKKNIQSSAELRTSFLMNIFGMIINNSAFIILWVFFANAAGNIGGWTANEVVGMLGFSALSYGVVFSFAGGLRRLPDYLASGVFDRFMLSPKNLIVRTATASFDASAVGDIIFGIVCLVVYFFLISATLPQILLTIFFACMTSLVFLGVTISIISVGFFFSDSSPVTQSLFELFITPSLFHGGAFQGVMRVIFTFIIPSLLIGAIPVEAVRDLSLTTALFVSILAIVWFRLSLFLFGKAVRKYESSNFMTFGSN
jgi:ABC-2 type transport system permease protein